MDHFDTWQVVPREVFTPYSCLLISTAFVFVSGVGCLVVSGVRKNMYPGIQKSSIFWERYVLANSADQRSTLFAIPSASFSCLSYKQIVLFIGQLR